MLKYKIKKMAISTLTSILHANPLDSREKYNQIFTPAFCDTGAN